MSPPFDSLRILLLQARRPGDAAKEDERRSFARRAGLDPGQFESHDLLQGPPTSNELRSYDAVMVGGSGDFYVSKENLPHYEATLEAMGELIETQTPTFASCFGFQLLVAALGGDIVHDPEGTEVGTYEVRLTDAGRDDPLFGTLPPRFPAQMGRKDRAEVLPDGVLHLAASERCPYHALRIPEAPVWGTQFHPELNREENLARFRRYLEGYAKSLDHDALERAEEGFAPSPESETLIPRFLTLVFGEGEPSGRG